MADVVSISALLLEDNLADARLVQELLRQAASESPGSSYQVTPVERLEAALQHLGQANFSVILSNLSLPDSTGLDTFRRLHQAAPATPIIILTGNDDDRTALQSVREGAQDFLNKGRLNAYTIARAIRYAIERAQAEQALQASETTFKILFANNPHPMWVYDLDTLGFLEVNEAAIAHYGYSREEFLILTIADIRPPEDIPRLREHLRAERPELSDSGQWRHKAKDGRLIEVEITTHTLDFSGRRAALVMAQDVTERARTQAALQASERRFRALTENSADAVALLNTAAVVLYASPGYLRILGLSETELVGTNAFELLHPHDVAYVQTTLAQLLQMPGQSVPAAVRQRHKNGSWRWLEGIATNLLPDPNIGAIVANFRDVTERRETEEQLRYQAMIAENISEAVITTDANSVIRSWNKAAETLHGYTAEEAIGRTTREVMRGNYLGLPREEVHRLLYDTGYYQGEYIGTRKDGSPLNLLITSSVLRDPNGAVIGMVAINRDITERKQAEEQLRYQAMIAENISEAVITADANSVIRSWNKAAQTLHGYTAEEVMGRSTREVLIGTYLGLTREEARQILYAVGRWEGEVIATRKDGSPVNILVTTSLLRDSSGAVTGMVAINRDITERKAAEAALRAGQAQLSEALQIARLAYWEYDIPNDEFIFNDHFFSIFHTTAEQVGGYRLSSAQYAQHFVHPDDLAVVGVEIGKALNSTDKHYRTQLDHRIQYADGGVGYISVRINIDRDDEGHILRYYGANQDITERKAAEAALQKSERHFRSLIENSADAIALLDSEGRLQRFPSPAAGRIMGYTSEETAGRPVFELIYPDDRQRVAELLQSLLKDPPAAVSIELRVNHKDGSLRWVEAVASNLLSDPAVAAIVINYRDITRRKEAEASLRYQATLLEHVTDAVVSTDEAFIIRSWNKAAEEIFGFTADEVVGLPVTTALKVQYFSADQNEVLQQLNNTGSWSGEIRIQGKSGRWIDIITSSSFLRDDFGRAIGYVSFNRDITERKQLESAIIHHADEMTVLHAVAQAATEAASENDLIERVSTIIGATLYPDNFGILMLDAASQHLVVHPSYHGMDPTSLLSFLSLNQGVVGQVAFTGQPLRVDDVGRHPGYLAASPATKSELCVPIRADTQVVGVINAESTRLAAFSEADEKLMITIAGQLATAIEKLRLFDALRKSEANYRTLVEQLPAIAYEVTLAQTPEAVNLTTYISPQVETILGYSPSDWMAQPDLWIDLIHPDDRARVVAEVRTHERDGESLSIEYRSFTRDGRVVWFHNRYSHIVSTDGQPHRLQGIMFDITERKQAEEALRESEIIFRRSIEAAGAVPYRRDHIANRYIYMGEGIRAITGYGPDEFTTELLETLVVENRLGGFAQGLNLTDAIRLARTGQLSQWYNDLLIRTRDGSLRWVADSSVELVNESGESLGSIGILQDVTDRRQREHEMETIAALSASLRTAASRAEIVPIVVDQVIEILQSDTATFVIHDQATGRNHIELSRGRLEDWTDRDLQAGVGIIGHVIETGRPYTTAELETDPIARDQSFFPPGTSVGCAPLIAQGETIGALSISRATPFSESDMRILAAIADIAANAYRRAALHDETRRRADQLAAVNRLGRTLSETFDVPAIYRQVHEHILQLIPDVATLFISSFDEFEQRLQCEYAMQDGELLEVASLPSLPLEPPGHGLQSTVIHSRQPLILNDLNEPFKKTESVFRVGTPGQATTSALLAPMLAKGAVRGVVQLQSYTANRFTQSDAEILSFVANTAAIAIENARLFAETQLRLQRMQALHRIDEAVSASLDLRLTLNVLLTQAITQLGVDAAGVLLVRPHNQALEFAAAQGFRTRAIEQTSVRLGSDITGRAALERRPTHAVRLTELGADFSRQALLAAEGFNLYYAVPVIAKGNIKGVLEFFHRSEIDIGHDWEDFADTLARQAAIAVENIVLFDDLQRTNTELTLAYDTTLEGWSHALDLRDRETEGHTERVTELAVQLGRAMGMGEAEILNLRRGALLHDIGKMGIPDSILLKQGPLTDAEWVIMRKHPIYAHDLLRPIAFLRNALAIPYCHHEKWDGTGYPRGLQGAEIPLAARLFAVVDVWDALRSDRPYRPAWPDEQVRAYLIEQSGQHFEPQIVNTFLQLLD